MARWTLHSLLITLILAFGCTDKGPPTFGQTGNGGSDGGTNDAGGTSDSGTPSDSGTADGGTDDEGFDDPGDIVGFDEQGGEASVELSDASGDSNQDQQFYMVLVDTADEDIGFQVRYDSTGSSGGTDTGSTTTSAMAPGDAPSGTVDVSAPHAGHTTLSPLRAGIRAGRADGSLGTASPPPLAPPPLDDSDIGVTVREFRVRSSLPDDTAYMTSSATLWAIGETVAIWVDAGVPIDWDIDCDGTVDVPAEYDAYGFDNCDLKTIADIVDFNIVPHLRSIFGQESDVNEDGLVSVLITPQLNVISYTSDDESVQGGLVGSYADPEVDLTEWNANTNPGSDEQELIYVFAPDPYGFFNPLSTATVDEYTSMDLAAQIAQSFFNLISYNQHVLVAGGSPEETWLSAGLGALAADLTGFGAVFYADAWDYLDAPQLYPLVTSGDGSGLSTDAIGAQYLFARWLYDAFGEDIMADLVQVEGAASGTTTGTTGTAGTDTVDPTIGTALIESVTTQSFDDLVVKWQLALITSGVTLDDGNALVTSETYPTYAGANTLTAPTSSPSSGDYYGANGYQQGIDLRGTNRYMEGGTTDSPVENTSKRVTMNGTDFFSAVTGIANWGYVQGSYGAQVVRLTDITIDNAFLKVQASTSGFVGAVVRWTDIDPLAPDTVVEQIFSVTKADNVDLPVLPTDGSSIYGVGEITEPGYTTVLMDDGTSEQGSVYDTDRWLLSLADHVTGESVDVAIHVTRHYSEGTSDAAPFDIWASVVPQEWIPTPTVDGTQRGSCTDGVDFQYPASMLEYLYYQLFTSSTDGVADFVASDETDPFSCGTVTTGTSCGEDWDRDGILDVDELTTMNYVDQVNAMLCTLNGNDASLFTRMTPEDLIDIDSLDDDDVSAFDRGLDLGGMADSSGEEAFIRATLEGGQNYLVVVGAGTYTGPYELEIKQVQ